MNIRRYWRLTLDSKIRYSLRLSERVLDERERPVICWSGGKDSTVLLHLLLQLKPDIPVVFVDPGVYFPETLEFVEKIKNEWGIKLFVAKPEKGQTFWNCVKVYGWPILGKDKSYHVETAFRSGNLRENLSAFERKLIKNGARISPRCCNVLLEKPSKLLEKRLGADVKFLGLMAEESRARVRLWADHGDYYFVKRYFTRKEGIWKANPLSIWTENDIWEYHSRVSLPKCSLYDKGHTRNGCWPCAMGVRSGQLKRLRRSHPKLFKYLITRTDMGRELLKVKFTAQGLNFNSDYIDKFDLKVLISQKPCFFDRF